MPALALLLGAYVAGRAQEAGAPARPARDERLERILDRVGEGVARYQAGLFSIAFTETFREEELDKDMTAKKSKELVYETVVLREALSADEDDFYPQAVRRLKTVDGKPAKAGERRAPPYGYNVQSLAFLLPKHRQLYEFSLDGEEALEGRAAHRIRVLRLGQGEPRVEWQRRLAGMRFHAFAPTFYLVWVDAETFEVTRLESHLVAPFGFDSPRAFGPFGHSHHVRFVKQDHAVRFRRRQFKDPEQTLLVPDSAEWLTIIEGVKRPRTRAAARFSDYRRFRSDVKVIEEPDE